MTGEKRNVYKERENREGEKCKYKRALLIL
jgi:hypothetical protein